MHGQKNIKFFGCPNCSIVINQTVISEACCFTSKRKTNTLNLNFMSVNNYVKTNATRCKNIKEMNQKWYRDTDRQTIISLPVKIICSLTLLKINYDKRAINSEI